MILFQFESYRVATKKNNQKFFKISQRVFVVQRSREFQNVLKYRKFFFWEKFWSCPTTLKVLPQAIFVYRPLKKGLKMPRWLQNRFFSEGSKNSNAPRFRVQGIYATQEFSKKIIFQTHKPKKIFFGFIDPQISKNIFFSTSKIWCFKHVVDLKNHFGNTFWDALGPPNSIYP